MGQSPRPFDPETPVEHMIRSLQSSTLFQGMENEEIKTLVRRCTRRQVKRYGTIFAETDYGDSLYFILNGQVYLTRRIGEEEEFLGILEKNDTFGETGLLMGGVRTATVRTKMDTLLLEFNKELIDNLPIELTVKFIRNIAITSNEKLMIANGLINRLYEDLRVLQPKPPDWQDEEDKFVEDFGEDPRV